MGDSHVVARVGGRTALVLAGAFALALLVAVPEDAKFGFDLHAYLGAADHLIAGQPIYPEPDAAGGITLGPAGVYPYPPIWAAVFVPLAGLPRDAVGLAWFACLVVLAVAVGAALIRPLDPAKRYWAAVGYIGFLPLISELRFGNLNLITLALCLLAWDRRERPIVSGLLFAVAIGLKLLPISILVFLLASGRWRVVAWAVSAWALAVAVTWPWMGSLWSEYATVVWAIITGTPAVSIVPELLTKPPLRYVLPVSAIAVAAIAGWATRRDKRLERAGFTVALGAAPLLANTVWYTYLIMALPASLGSDGRRPALRPVGSVPARVAGWLLMEIPFGIFPLLGLVVTIAAGLQRLIVQRGSVAPGPSASDLM